MPRSAFQHVVQLTPVWNTLVDKISRDEDFLLQQLEPSVHTPTSHAQIADVSRADPWLAKLLSILTRLRKEGRSVVQPIRLGIYRSDYMVHAEEEQQQQASATSQSTADAAAAAAATPASANGVAAAAAAPARIRYTPLQVELNTISCSFQGLSARVAQMHQFLLQRELNVPAETLQHLTPPNHAVDNIVKGMETAFRLYTKQHPAAVNPVVVMVVQPGESNAVDQRILEYTLWTNHSIPLIRRSLREIAEGASFDDSDQLLLDDGRYTAAIFYFRAGYTPRDYPSDREYDAIYLMERSRAIKCPSLAVHLAGTKKIQQVLAQPHVLERFLAPQEAQQLRTCFAGLYAIDQDDEQTHALLSKVYVSPSSFVLKPQREGGGNNLWNEEMVRALKRMSSEERAAYILMQKIEPIAARAALFRSGAVTLANCVSEVGIFSVFVGDGSTEHHSEYCGYLLRTKPVGVDEGGVAAGYACLSSILFADCTPWTKVVTP